MVTALVYTFKNLQPQIQILLCVIALLVDSTSVFDVLAK